MKIRIKLLMKFAVIFSFIISALIVLRFFFPKNHAYSNTIIRPRTAELGQKMSRLAEIYIAAVACGQKFEEVIVMIKSVIIFNQENVAFLLFIEENLTEKFNNTLTLWQRIYALNFSFKLFPLKFPKSQENEWRKLFKPCAAQRLFLPSLLSDTDAILYVDTDILFLSPVRDLWNHFKFFNGSQLAALSNEHEDVNMGWYKRFSRHPFYGKFGLNSGVMLMNLTRMRDFKWEDHILSIYKKYKPKITWGDQDLINILFYYYSEKVYVFPCHFNYRPDHCMYTSVCNISSGIKILHGNRGYFHSDKQPLFKAIYKAIESHEFEKDTDVDLIRSIKYDLEEKSVIETTCGKVRKDILKQTQEM